MKNIVLKSSSRIILNAEHLEVISVGYNYNTNSSTQCNFTI